MSLHLIYCDEWFWLKLKNMFQTDFKINLKLALNKKKRFIFSPLSPWNLARSPPPACSLPFSYSLGLGHVKFGPVLFPPPFFLPWRPKSWPGQLCTMPLPSLLPLTSGSRALESQTGGAHLLGPSSTSCPHRTPPRDYFGSA